MANEKRLIDANALIEEAVKAKIRMPYDKAAVFDLIEKAPTVDAVEVVRCKECRYYNPDSEYCGFWGACRHPEHYCGEGDSNV